MFLEEKKHLLSTIWMSRRERSKAMQHQLYTCKSGGGAGEEKEGGRLSDSSGILFSS